MRTWRRLLLWLIAAPLGLYLLYVGLLYVFQDALVFPAPNIPAEVLHAYAVEAGATEVHIPTSDGESLYAWHLAGTGDKAILFFHGNGSSPFVIAGLREVVGPEWHVVGIAYRGYPGSTGKATEAGLAEDGRAAWRYVTQELGIPGSRVVVHGRSLGGGVASYLVQDATPAALVMESTFTSLVEVAQRKHRLAPVGLLLRSPFRTRDRAPSFQGQVLVLHGGADQLIPAWCGRALGELFPHAEQHEYEGFDHDTWLAVQVPEARAAYQRFVGLAVPDLQEPASNQQDHAEGGAAAGHE